MADTHSTVITRRPKADDELVIEGAKAAIAALQEIESISANQGYVEGTVEDGVNTEAQRRKEAVQAVMQAIGDLPPHQRGFVMALAEYIDHTVYYDETPHLEMWVPDASMTSAELEKFREEEIAALMEVV